MNATSKTNSAPTAPAAASIAPPRRRWPTFAAVGVILATAAIWLIAARGRDEMPRLNDNAVDLAKFVHSDRFDQLPFEQQRQYYKVMDDRGAELDQAYAAKRLTESEYRSALEAEWLGKHIGRVEKYFALAPGTARMTFIEKLLEKKEKKKPKPKNGAEEINIDETAAEMRVEKWPAAARTQWTTFHDAYHAQHKALEKAHPQTKPTHAAK